MSENESTPEPRSPEGAPEAISERGRGFSPIWLIPIVVALIAVVLAYDAVQNRQETVVVLFQDAGGLHAGKSKIKYRDIEIGTVDQILLRDLDTVEVHCSIEKPAAPYLTESAKWWIVRPRIGGGNISGLETIVSGAYLTLEPGRKGDSRKREFVGLEEPPIHAGKSSGTEFVLHAEQLGGVGIGSRVYFRDIEAGEVVHTGLSKDGTGVEIRILVNQGYAPFVTSTSRFWDAGGVDVALGPQGLDIKTESLRSLVQGGVAFDSPAGGTPAKQGAEFWMNESWAAVHRTASTHGGLRLTLETGALGGVAPGNPVYYREVPVGSVVSHELSKDGREVRITVNVEPRYETLVRSNSVFWNASGLKADLGLSGLHIHAESLKSLLSGGVAFATPPRPGHRVSAGSVFRLHPEAKDEWLAWETDIAPEKGDPQEEHHGLARFFHHEGKSEAEAKQEDPSPEPDQDDQKHGFLHRLFHPGS